MIGSLMDFPQIRFIIESSKFETSKKFKGNQLIQQLLDQVSELHPELRFVLVQHSNLLRLQPTSNVYEYHLELENQANSFQNLLLSFDMLEKYLHNQEFSSNSTILLFYNLEWLRETLSKSFVEAYERILKRIQKLFVRVWYFSLVSEREPQPMYFNIYRNMKIKQVVLRGNGLSI